MTSSTPGPDKIFVVGYGENGYTEGANNANKYAAVVGVANNEAWCTTFCSWEFKTAGFQSLCLMSNYSVDQYNWFNARGRASSYPAVGAVVWFGPGGENHTGWVYAYDATYIYTIEGNYGNMVALHKRKRVGNEDPSIGAPFMYGLPNFAEGVVSADPNHAVAGSKYAAVASVTTAADVPGIVDAPPVVVPPVDPPPVVTPPVTTPEVTYTVKTGDTWASIAASQGLTLTALVTLNKPTPGDVLEIAPATTTTPPPVTPPVDTTDYTAYPGASKFVLGQSNGYVLQLTTWLKAAGGTVAPTSTFTSVVQSEMAAYQVAQGYSGSDADGIPGATTWGLLKTGTGVRLGGTTVPPSAWVNNTAINEKTAVSYARYTAGGTVASWIAAACAARGITGSTAVAAWTKGYQTAISRESSGDANACNTNDSNDKTPAGYSMVADFGTGYGNPNGNLNGQLVNYQCSRGVAQCIPQTFAANHCPGTSNGIYDPVANIAASMGYVRAQYGVSVDGHDLASKVQQFDSSRSPAGY